MTSAAFHDARKRFHARLLASILNVTSGVPSNADKSNASSVAIAKGMVAALGTAVVGIRASAQIAGNSFEDEVRLFIEETFLSLKHLCPGVYKVERILNKSPLSLAKFFQYAHLMELDKAIKEHPELRGSISLDYGVAPDIVVYREPESDASINRPTLLLDSGTAIYTPLRRTNNELPLLHGSVSCKWTLRSDRAQNARSEALNLLRNRKGALPHVAVVTAEPLPSRLASLAQGTGDIDCVYHVALPELLAAGRALPSSAAAKKQLGTLETLVNGRRLRDIADLALDLAA